MKGKKEKLSKNNYIQKLISQFLEKDKKQAAFTLYDGVQVKEISYEQFACDILEAAAFYKEKGFRKKHIALVGYNSYAWLVQFLAIVASGNVAVPMNPDLPQNILLHQCEMAEISLVCGAEKKVEDLSIGVVGFSFDKVKGVFRLAVEDVESSEPDDTSVLMFTSGTTEKMKIVEITYRNMDSGICSAEGVFSVPEMDRVMMVLPLFHIAALRSVLTLLHRDKTICMARGAQYLFQDMVVFEPSYVLLVPVMVETIAKIIKNTSRAEAQEKFLGMNLKRICVGGATIDTETCRFLTKEGFVVDTGYGMTETTGVGSWGCWDEQRDRSVGRLSEELQCRVEDGELLFKGPCVMKGYFKNPEATEKVLKDGWLYSGDLGYCDENGYYYITGRKKRLIVMPNGEKVNPEEVELHLKACDAVLECVVYHNGKVICVNIYTKDEGQVRRFIKAYNDSMPSAYQIRKINCCSEPFEKTSSGKVRWKGNW